MRYADSMTSSPRPVLYMDFDGVLNFFGSRTAHRKLSGGLGHLRRGDVWAAKAADGELKPTEFGGSHSFELNWSGELVRKLRALNTDWLWLTSWKADAPKFLDPRLDVVSDGWLDWEYSAASGWNHALKFNALLVDQDANPRPFVWLDDEATGAFDADAFLTPVPHLVLRPSELVGLTMGDLLEVIDFVNTGVSLRTSVGS